MRSTITRAALSAVVLGGLLAAWAQGGRAQQEPRRTDQEKGVGRRIGAALDGAAQSLKKGAKELGEDVRQGFQRTRESVNAMGIESRVYGRIRWDKALQNARVELDVDRAGVVTLRGTVPDSAARKKAVVLASDTVGVTGVEDQMTVGPTDQTTTTETIKTSPDGATTVKKKVTVEKRAKP